ncbi:hypothetical protein A2Z33_01125 [Candidatus Gottesmanbacteria bacterium RBG_16_52_11]|uniref:Uncharacterized protein n=1 Tax=Candidatus Gottesmanbacteria bacterium RBG_16_52_11 TaxID=1798374 RepID=A0A1F5YPC4_9BACT|nr:MAG: hypothetical protein A2Z33_01125 [Candidatus Gottesmanbacteria bacterium RBG_16_52_11]
MASSNINLLKRQSALPEYLAPIESQYKNLSILALFVVLIIGMITLAAYLTMQVRYRTLESTKKRLLTQLEDERPKETKLMAIKSRIDVVEKIIEKTKPVARVLQTAVGVAPPPVLSNITMESLAEAAVNYHPGSLDESIVMTDTVIGGVGTRLLADPMLRTFQLNEDGISISYSFRPVWESP